MMEDVLPPTRYEKRRKYLEENLPPLPGDEPAEDDDEPDPDDEPIVEPIDGAEDPDDESFVNEVEPDPIEAAIAQAARRYGVHERNRISMCVRCGRGLPNRGNKPHPDENGIAWLKCPSGCEPTEGTAADATCVPLDRRMGKSVLDRSALDPDDALGPDEPDPDDEPAVEVDAPGEPTRRRPRRHRPRLPLRDDLPTGRRGR